MLTAQNILRYDFYKVLIKKLLNENYLKSIKKIDLSKPTPSKGIKPW